MARTATFSPGWVLGLLAVTLGGGAVRIATLDVHSFWYDEAVTQELIRQPMPEVLNGTARDNGNPQLYLIAACVWQQLVGEGDAKLRGLSALFGVLTIPALALLGRRLVSSAVGLVAAGLFAVSPLELEFAQEARAYALLHLLAVVNAWLFARWLNDREAIDCAGYSLTMFLAWHTHYYAIFLPLTHGLVLLVAFRDPKAWLGWVGAMLAATAAYAVWLPILYEQITTPGNLTRLSDGWKVQFPATPVAYAAGRTLVWRESPVWLIALAGASTVVGFVVPAMVGVRQTFPQRGSRTHLLGWLLLPILLPLVAALLGKPLYSHRYAAVGLPAFLLLVAAGLVALPVRWRVPLGVVAIALTAVSLVRYFTEPLKDDWRSATLDILKQARPGDLLVFDSAIEVSSFRHYAGPTCPSDAVALDLRADGIHLDGFRVTDGERTHTGTQDYSDLVYRRQRVCLILCVPARSADAHTSAFQTHGYALSGQTRVHRIQILWFTR
jgi:mannosyltransferase